jgi:FkbM family methyltransferase
MKKLLEKIHTYTNKFIRKLRNKETPEEIQYKRVTVWNNINGDKTLRLNYPLTNSSLVIDVGGFEGQWASDIFSKYCCKVIIFEPVEKFAHQIKERFKNNTNIRCYQIGLSNKDANIPISIQEDRSSFVKESSNKEIIQTADASKFFIEHAIHSIDLMKMNIEGAEYDLLDGMIQSGFIKNIQNIQVQFHDFAPDAKNRMAKIHTELLKTHHPTYQYEFVWENWERNAKS